MGFIQSITDIIMVCIFSGASIFVARYFGDTWRHIEKDRQDTLRAREYTRQVMYEAARSLSDQKVEAMRADRQISSGDRA